MQGIGIVVKRESGRCEGNVLIQAQMFVYSFSKCNTISHILEMVLCYVVYECNYDWGV